MSLNALYTDAKSGLTYGLADVVPAFNGTIGSANFAVSKPTSEWNGTTAVIKALATNNKLADVQTGSIITQNGVPSSLKLTTNTDIIRSIQFSTIAQAGAATTAAQATTIPTGFSLQILPRIVGNSEISLIASVENSAISGETQQSVGQGASIDLLTTDRAQFLDQRHHRIGRADRLAGLRTSTPQAARRAASAGSLIRSTVSRKRAWSGHGCCSFCAPPFSRIRPHRVLPSLLRRPTCSPNTISRANDHALHPGRKAAGNAEILVVGGRPYAFGLRWTSATSRSAIEQEAKVAAIAEGANYVVIHPGYNQFGLASIANGLAGFRSWFYRPRSGAATIALAAGAATLAAFPLDDDRWLVLAIDRKGILPDGDMIVANAEQAKARIEALVAQSPATWRKKFVPEDWGIADSQDRQSRGPSLAAGRAPPRAAVASDQSPAHQARLLRLSARFWRRRFCGLSDLSPRHHLSR